MKNIQLFLKHCQLAIFSIGIIFIVSCSDTQELEVQTIQEGSPSLAKYNSTPIEGQYIIIMNDVKISNYSKSGIISYQQKLQSLKKQILTLFSKAAIKEHQINHAYTRSFQGFSARLDKKQLAFLKKDKRIKHIEQDYTFQLSPIENYKRKPKGGGGGTATQSTPWGITRVGGIANYSGNAKAWIIDSGIDLDHPDLNVDVTSSRSFLSRGGADDQNGHGTHVAGTVAAINNSTGVIGVAPGATVVAIRVLDRRGSGSYSGVIAGVDYVTANASTGDVANMSLGGGVSKALDDAVIALAASGVKIALAAGNASDDAENHSPARANHANIYTVSAFDSNDNYAYFSNYGNPPIDFCAPGVSIKSTWKSGGYNTISGTSMAAPHVCGLLLLGVVKTDGTVKNDPDGNSDAIAHH
ncbi:MAG: peptidase S8 [Flavobacteriaceae bacterium]|nr:MAG: peptidase S8 [Flavobacteriaceae bacterium]